SNFAPRVTPAGKPLPLAMDEPDGTGRPMRYRFDRIDGAGFGGNLVRHQPDAIFETGGTGEVRRGQHRLVGNRHSSAAEKGEKQAGGPPHCQNSSAALISPESFFGATASQLLRTQSAIASQSLSPRSSQMPTQPSPK